MLRQNFPFPTMDIKHPARNVVGVRQDAATALLAKIYFQMNDFDKALVEVDKLLGPVSSTGSSKYPLTSVFCRVSLQFAGKPEFWSTRTKK
jgi:hypothetical protein